MIKIDIRRSKEGRIRSFSSKGHAGYAEKGSDIVCSAVSVLVINTLNSIERLLPEDSGKMEVKTDEGLISVKFQDEPSEKAELLLETMYLGLTDVRKNYGKYIEIKEDKEL